MNKNSKSDSIDRSISGAGAPFLLMGLLWNAVSIAITAFDTINRKRDEIVALINKCGKCQDMIIGPEALYFSNLLPISFGICLIYGVLSYAVLSVGYSPNVTIRVKKASRIIFILPFYSCIAYTAGLVFDAIAIFTHL